MKFDDRLANKVIKKEEFEQQQQKLRKKYDVEEEGIIRIEKKRLTEVLDVYKRQCIRRGGYIRPIRQLIRRATTLKKWRRGRLSGWWKIPLIIPR